MVELSVIICTYNREEYILQTLQALANQNIDPDKYEVLVIDNNSTDNTEKICKKFIEKAGNKLFYYYKEYMQGLTFARNRGISESKGVYISFLDDDARAKTDYCGLIIDFFKKNPQVIAIGGKITPVYEGEKPVWMSSFLLPLVAGLDLGNTIKEFKGSRYPIGANMAFRADAFKKYGTFNEKLGRRGSILEGGEEKDMIYRLKKNHETIMYVPEINVNHIIPEKRTQLEYIRDQAIGVGKSEKKRLRGEGRISWLKKILSELFKLSASIILAFYYTLIFKYPKGIFLLRFRMWVLRGYILKEER